MAVALAAEPKVLLLDEPFTGMNPEETRNMMELVTKIRERGVTPITVDVSEFLKKGGGSVKCMIGDLGVVSAT